MQINRANSFSKSHVSDALMNRLRVSYVCRIKYSVSVRSIILSDYVTHN